MWEYTECTREDLRECFVALNALAMCAPQQHENAVQIAFRSRQYMRVSALPVPLFPRGLDDQ